MVKDKLLLNDIMEILGDDLGNVDISDEEWLELELRITPSQHISELKEVLQMILGRAENESYRGNIDEAIRILYSAKQVIDEVIIILKAHRERNNTRHTVQ